MVYFCADDYGISQESNNRIEKCLTDGILNKVSVLPNGTFTDFREKLSVGKLSLHINLIEGAPLSDPKELDLIVGDDGYFKHSFAGLFLLSFSKHRKKLQKQLYKEISAQVRFWKEQMGDEPLCMDSHQHTHMIPLVLKTLLQVIKDEKVEISALRYPAEPLLPFLLNPSLYLAYKPVGLIKHWILKVLGWGNYIVLKRTRIPTTCFMGIMFSGTMTQDKIEKLLPLYMKTAKRREQPIEIAFHPGYVEAGEKLLTGHRPSFEHFYHSPGRKAEFDSLMNMKFEQ